MDIVGNIPEKVFNILNITPISDNNIYFGETNRNHMKKSHPGDYSKYGNELQNILLNPDYIGKKPNDNSIEFVKEFKVDNEFVKVAVRLNNSGNKYYARSLYTLDNSKVYRFISKGTLKKV